MGPEPIENLSASPTVTVEAVGFSATADEYFRIWIVNFFLTLVTLGIYSPWAKVRRNKYIYRHTHLAEASFDYHANPVAILKGRLIALAMLGAYVLSSFMFPAFSLLILFAIFAAMPWLLVRARMFAMRNTSYRNVRFRFRPVFAESYKVVFGFTVIAILTLGLGYPWARYRRAKMFVDNTAYGTLDMQLGDEVSGGDFFGIYFAAGCFIAFLAFVTTAISTAMLGDSSTSDGDGPVMASLWVLGLQLILIVVYLVAYYAIDLAVTRLVINSTSAGQHRLRCSWSLPQLLFVQMTNLAAMVVSLGLLIPWATIRLNRHKLTNISVEVQGDLASIAAGEAEEVSALGEEVGEVFDYDFGL